MSESLRPKFALGRLLITPAARDALPRGHIDQALQRHASGDWGELCNEDRAENELALVEGFRLLSAYRSESGIKFWIITEADRSATTILLPEDY